MTCEHLQAIKDKVIPIRRAEMGNPISTRVIKSWRDELSNSFPQVLNLRVEFRRIAYLANVSLEPLVHVIEASEYKLSMIILRIDAKPVNGAASGEVVHKRWMNDTNGRIVCVSGSGPPVI